MKKKIRLIALLLAALMLLAACGSAAEKPAEEKEESGRREAAPAEEEPAAPAEEEPAAPAEEEPAAPAEEEPAAPAEEEPAAPAEEEPAAPAEEAPAAPAEEEPAQPEPTPAPTPEPTPEPLPVVTPEPTPEPTPVPTPEPTPVASAVRVIMKRQDTASYESVLLLGLDAQGSTVWMRSFNTEYRTELDLIQEIGTWQDRYYFNNNGWLTAIRVSNGETIWSNGDFGGASISYLLGGNGNIYICGYYGPDFYAINADGQTLINYRSISDDYYWPSDLRWYSDWEIEGTFYGGADVPQEGVKFIIDLSKPSYRMAD